jgi:glycerate dehydrogenase
MKPIIAERKNQIPRIGRFAFTEVVANSDVLCITCPLSPETRGLIGTAEIATMRSSAVLINCARGGIVDDSALADALDHGRIAGAGVDVLEEEPPRNGNPLLSLKLPNLIVTPHMAFASKFALQSLADQLIGNVEAFLEGHPTNVVT